MQTRVSFLTLQSLCESAIALLAKAELRWLYGMLQLMKGSQRVGMQQKGSEPLPGPILRMRLQRSVELFSFLFDDLLR